MSLFAFNKTASPYSLALPPIVPSVRRQIAVLPTSGVVGVRGAAVILPPVILRRLSPSDFAGLEAQRVAGLIDFQWSGIEPDLGTDTLRVRLALSIAIISVLCRADDMPGSAVYVTGPATEYQQIQVATANPNDAASMPALGVLLSKNTPTSGLVQTLNVATGIYSGLTPRALYYVAVGGGISAAPPPPGAIVQAIGIAVDVASLLIFPPVPPSGGATGAISEQIDKVIPAADQTAFTLSQLPLLDSEVAMFVDGIEQKNGATFSVVATAVTWLDVNYRLDGKDLVEFRYTIATLPQQVDQFVANLDQTGFTLSQLPLLGSEVEMFVDGVQQRNGDAFTVAGTLVTWLNDDYPLDTHDLVEFRYTPG